MKRALFVLVALSGAATAHAGIVGKALTVTSRSETGASASWSLDVSSGTWSNTKDGPAWSWVAPVGWSRSFVGAAGEDLGKIESTELQPFSVTFIEDPVVAINFTAIAGALPTNFTFSSGLLVFAPIAAPLATASAGVTVTDRNGNGATLTGGYLDGSAHKAAYNGLVPGGTNFASFNLNTATGAFGTQVTTAGTGPLAPIGPAFDMSSEFSFTLSANDSVGGTSVFAIIPTPGSLALIGATGLVLSRRRRA